MSITGRIKAAAGFAAEEAFEHGKSSQAHAKAEEGRTLRNEGRIEDGQAPKTTRSGTDHPRTASGQAPGASEAAPSGMATGMQATLGECSVTPDGRYLVVRGRLWRRSNPALTEDDRQHLVDALMAARRAVAQARKQGDAEGEAQAHALVGEAKHALGERGAVWWDDGAPDYNRHMARNTPYAAWFAAQQ